MAVTQNSIEMLRSIYAEEHEKLVQDYLDFLRIPSVSTDPAFAEEVLHASRWVADYLKRGGFDVDVWDTTGHPVVYAHWMKAGPQAPTLLLYGHYDVQPVDPIDEWNSDPFEPTIRQGEVYARGAQDNKGQLIYKLCALCSLLKREGSLPLNVKVLVEGEEECQSIGLEKILDSKHAQLEADYLVSADFDVPSLDQPAVVLGLRGMVALSVELRGSKSDLHSGMHGGIVYNPNRALVEIFAKLHDERGRVTVPGFYDGIEPLTDEERALLSLEFDEATYTAQTGAAMNGGEEGYTPGESNRIRPTLEINGIAGGYGGPGVKTVIPAKAIGKLSCRLVPGQDGEKILAALKKTLQSLCPKGIEMTITEYGAENGLRTSPKSRLVEAIAESYTEVFGKECQLTLSGASVPIMAKLSEAAHAQPAFIGVGLSTDGIHAPNEHFGIDRLQIGFLLVTRILQRLGESK